MFDSYHQAALDYRRIADAITYLDIHFKEQPSLDSIAAEIGISPYHFQRLFTRWAGVSPKRYLQYVTKEHAKIMLRESRDLLRTALGTGLSGPGRLHDLFVTWEGVTPGEYKSNGSGLRIEYGTHDTPFGEALVAATGRGICGLYFTGHHTAGEYIERLHRHWPRAEIVRDEAAVVRQIGRIFDRRSDRPEMIVRGTPFQKKVWEALLHIPEGTVATYSDVAQSIGQPQAVRAVGSAVAGNPISYLIPCHRVIRKEGEFGEYQGGVTRKKAMLALEYARRQEVMEKKKGRHRTPLNTAD